MDDRKTLSPRASARYLPTEPGVYIMKDPDGEVIYVGKAKNLRSRVGSYFTGEKDPKTAVLRTRVAWIEHIVTRNEYEALLLENNLIKEHAPRYNINLKDGKSYPVIRITNEPFPRVFRTRTIVDDGSQYFGPYTDLDKVDQYLELIERLYPLRKCRGRVKPRPHPCLYYHIGRCSAPCAGKTTKESYNENVERIRRLLDGETEELRRELEHGMSEASERLEFERAAEYRDGLRAIEALAEDQQVMDFDPDVRDYIGYAVKDELCSFAVFQMRGGKLVGNETFHTPVFGTEEEVLTQFLMRYYDELRTPPARLLLPRPIELHDFLTFLREKHGAETAIEVPEAGRDASLLRMAVQNATSDIEKRARERGNLPALEELKRVLSLPQTPLRIEGFDIAQLSGKHPVAALVSFNNGIPDKDAYRRYHIKTLEGKIDDYEAMREVVARRYTRVVNERAAKPDLILIDGGIGQVNAASEVLQALGLDSIVVVGLAKQNEEIFRPHTAEPLRLPEGSAPLRVLQYVRDEAHRFATGFNQQLRSKDIGLSQLESIPGIGPARSRTIMQRFESLQNVAEADPEYIAEICKLGVETAGKVRALAARVTTEAASSGKDRPAVADDKPAARTAHDGATAPGEPRPDRG